MRIAIITTYNDLYAGGPRKLASFLQLHGFDVTQIFLMIDKYVIWKGPSNPNKIQSSTVNEILNLVADCDVVGFSAMTDSMPIVRQLGKACRDKYDKKLILLGGPYAIESPEHAIAEPFVDGVCTGEGELPLLELMNSLKQKISIFNTRGFYFRTSQGIIRNPCGDYVDLDTLPFIDFDDGYILYKNKLEPVNEVHIKKCFGTTYFTILSRGCPYRCAYCIHSKLFADKNNPVRWNSIKYFIAETTYILNKYPWLNSIFFFDETLTVQNTKKLSEFSTVYKKTIGLPFSPCIDPFSCSLEKIDLLFDAGMTKVKMGIQSGSPRIMKDYFDRNADYSKLIEITDHIGKKVQEKRSLPFYEFITSIPWATKKDIEDNFYNIARLGTPFHCQVYTLAFYPGSKLFEDAVKDRLVDPDNLPFQNFIKTEPLLSNSIIQLMGFVKLPDFFVKWLIKTGLASSKRKIPFLFKFTTVLTFIRRAYWQLTANDSSLIPYRIVVFFQKFGFFNTRKDYEIREKNRNDYLQDYQPPIGKNIEAILIDTKSRKKIFGSFLSKFDNFEQYLGH